MKKILLLILLLFLVSCGSENQECIHDYVSIIIKQPTCQEAGTKEYKCNECGDTYTEEIDLIKHEYHEGKCVHCGATIKKSYLYELFGDNITIYTNEEENPYGIDLNNYGSNVKAYIYEPDLTSVTDPYQNVNKEEFYNNYERAKTYEEAYYRSKHFLMSGDIKDQYYLPNNDGKIMVEEKAIRITDATYVLDTQGNYLAYIPNVVNEENYILFYGAAYVTLNDVAAYLLAFGTPPINQISKKSSSGQTQAISLWGKYGRVNDSRFSGDTSKYPYEPKLPNILGSNAVLYHEIDFGTTGGYTTKNSLGFNKTQTIYNNGSRITRGAARLVYVADTSITKIDERYVFYTYNHYNDFQEYLNYHDGWGIRFGNESAGNEYCSGTSDYYDLGCIPPTKYPEALLKKYQDII